MSHEYPYLSVDVPTREMKGKGSPRPTLFGVLGHTIEDSSSKSLGGLVRNTKVSGPVPPTTKNSVKEDNTVHKIAGSPSKTPVPGVHYGMVPFAGHYRSAVGAAL